MKEIKALIASTAVRTAGLNKKQLPDNNYNQLITDYADLTSTGKDMTAWYRSVIRRVGAEKFCRLASIARVDGIDKPRYFSWLLKREMTSLRSEPEGDGV